MAFFAHRAGGGAHVVAGFGGVQMVMLVRNKKEYFTDFIAREAQAKDLKLVINGSFTGLSLLTKMQVYTPGADPLDPSETEVRGRVVQKGQIMTGESSTEKFRLSQDHCGDESFSVDMGNPIAEACAAIGGIAPILVNGLPHGVRNLYKRGVPAGAPEKGPVGAKYLPFLIQKNNDMYRTLQSRGPFSGNTAVGYSSSTKKTLIIVQQDGQAGIDADEFRSVFQDNAIDNAVFFDGSDSSTLFYDGKFLSSPGPAKNAFLTVAVGFK